MTTPPPDSDARIAVVTVSYGSAKVLPDFLASIPAAASGAVEIVVADNKPLDDGQIELLTRAAGGRYLPLPENPGYGGGMNRAVAVLGTSIEWILISNPDVVLGERSIDRLVAAGSSDSSIGAVGPAVLTPGGDVYPSARRVPSLRTGVGHALFYNLWPNNIWSRRYLSGMTAEPRDAGWLSGSCLLVRRDAFDALGGFDESYFMYFEDVDLGDRMSKAGYRNVYRPDSVVVHTGAHATSEASAMMLQAHHESASRFLSRKYSGALLLPLRLALKAGLSARAAIEGRRARYHSAR